MSEVVLDRRLVNKLTRNASSLGYTTADVDCLLRNIRTNSIGCWIRGNDSTLYTAVRTSKGKKQAHRFVLELLKHRELVALGCHHCDTPACINPDHLHEGTSSWNARDAVNKGRVFGVHFPKYKTHSVAVKSRNIKEALEVRDSLLERLRSC